MDRSDITLNVMPRTEAGSASARRLRRSGRVPCIAYGGGSEPLALSADARELADIAAHAGIVSLHVDGEKGSQHALIHAIQHNHLGTEILHVDFIQVRMDQPITTEVPLETQGTAEGSAQGGELHIFLYDLEVKCLPANIPEMIVVDVTSLKVGEALTIGDISLPDGVEATAESDIVVVQCAEPRVSASDDDADAAATESEAN